MRHVIYLILGVVLTILSSSRPSEAALVSFDGMFTSGVGSLLGNLPPARSFNAQLIFDPISPGFGTISSGQLTLEQVAINVTGGNIILSDVGANDQATIIFNTSGPTGAVNVSFIGNAISNSIVNESNLNALIRASAPASISANFGNAGSYTGSVTAVPEPGSFMLGVFSLAVAGVGYRIRRRTRADQQQNN